MYRRVNVVAVLAAVAMLVLAAALPTATAASSERPFKGNLTAEGVVVPDAGCPGGLRTLIRGSGHVTHLGLTLMTSSHCTPAVGAPIAGGVQTFVAANGDRLELAYSATVEPFEFVDGAVMTGPGRTVVTGGTGRFAHASGEFVVTMRGILHLTAPMELTFSWDGAITY